MNLYSLSLELASGFHLMGGIVVRRPPGKQDLGMETCFSQSSHINDFKLGALVTALLRSWHDRVSAWTGWLGVTREP